MKTACKKIVFYSLVLLASAVAYTPAHAVDASMNGAPPAPAANDPAPALTPLPSEDGRGSRGLANAEDKAIDQAKGVMRRLDQTETMTLDDLNSANQAVAKITVLIDLEKHLNELQRLRDEREGVSNKPPVFAPIPASVLAPPMQQAVVPVMPAEPAVFTPGGNEVVRIVGSAGRYSAFMKGPDGQTKEVQVGDHVSGLGTVVAISIAGVEVEQNHSRHMLKVKNVNVVYGSAP